MSTKLLKLRKYLKIEEAAKYLSDGIGEKVTNGEVIRLVLDKYLIASIVFDELELGRYGKIVKTKTGANVCYSLFGGYLELDEDVTGNILPYFDVPMIGKEVDLFKELFVEYACKSVDYFESYRMVNSVILKDGDQYFQLFEEYDHNPGFVGSNASFDRFFDDLTYSNNSLKEMRTEHENSRAVFLKENYHFDQSDQIYVPAISFPERSSLVFKIEELDRFIQNFANGGKSDDQVIKKTMITKEKNTLLVLIAALCKQADIDYSQRGVSTAIEMATEELGARISDDTIRKVLKEIPDALESRSK